MAAAQLEFNDHESNNADKFLPILVDRNKRKLEESTEDSGENGSFNKPKRRSILFADDAGMPLSVEHIIPSFSDSEAEENNEEIEQEEKVEEHPVLEKEIKVEHQELEGNGAEEEVFLNPEHFLTQTQTTDLEGEVVTDVNSVIGASAETLFTLSNIYESGKKRVMYSCNVCEEEFRDKRTCIRHIRVHTGEKPFKCLECGISFSREDNLKKHLKSHSIEKQFSCPICYKEFKRKDYLDQHLLLHDDRRDRPFPCNQCEKGYVKRSQLERHMKTHNKDYDFYCTKCGKGFREKRHLNDHFNRIHTNKPKAQCEICFREFKSDGHLRTHTNAAHKQSQDVKEDVVDESAIENTHKWVQENLGNLVEDSLVDQ